MFKWVAVKKGFACFVDNKGIGAVIKHNKGSWWTWVLTASKTPYEASGIANGVDAAKAALVERWNKEQGN